MTSSPTCSVVVDDVRSDIVDSPLDIDRWAELARTVATAEGGIGELTLTFVDAEEIADLNARHMGNDKPTDVLSFPMDDDVVPGVPTLLGDIVVCPAVAREQWPSHAGSYDDELALLVVHGVLHVLGHDHADTTEAELMRSRELALLIAHHWGGPAPDGFRQTHDGGPGQLVDPQ